MRRAGVNLSSAGTGSACESCDRVAALVAEAYGFDVAALKSATRGPAPVAAARQVAMYLAHVSAGLTLTDVGNNFGRDRTTVAHACAIVEDARDDRDFDRWIEALEGAFAPRAVRSAA